MITKLEIQTQIEACKKEIDSYKTMLCCEQQANDTLQAANTICNKEISELKQRLHPRKYAKTELWQHKAASQLRTCKLTGRRLKTKIERYRLNNTALRMNLETMQTNLKRCPSEDDLNAYNDPDKTEFHIMTAVSDRQKAAVQLARSTSKNNDRYPDLIVLLSIELYTQCGGNAFKTIKTLEVLNLFFDWKMRRIPLCSTICKWARTSGLNTQNDI
jgi:hypothetical protein